MSVESPTSSARRRGRRYVPIAVTLCTGVAASIAAWTLMQNWEEQRLHATFQRAAGNKVSALRRGIETALFELESVGAFFAGSHKVERDEFRAFVEHLSSRGPGIRAVEWIPRVPHSRCAEYEEAARRDGFPDFQITERLAKGRMVRTAQREEYFPVYYVEPYEGNEPVLGFDLASNPARLRALARSRDTGEMVATARITLVQETAKQDGFLVFLPIYRKGAPIVSVEDRRENLEGFAMAVFRIGDIVDKSLAYLGPEGIDVHVYDKSAPEGRSLLHFHTARTRETPTEPICEEEALSRTTLRHAATIDLPDRTWSVLCTPTPAYITAGRTWQPWVALVGGLALTGLLVGYIQVSMARTASVEAANRRLTKEITERERAEQAIREERDRAQSYLDIAGTMIALVDPSERITLINQKGCEILGYQREELLGQNWFDLLVPQRIRAEVRGVFQKLMAGDIAPVEYYENPLLTRDGEERLIAFHNTVLTEPSDRITAALLSAEDITERKQAEENLAQAHQTAAVEAQKLRSMIEGMDEGIVVADAADIITEVNEWFLDKVELGRDDIIGKSLWEFHPDTKGTARLRAAVEAFRSGERCEKFVVNRELLGMQLSLRVQPIFESQHYRGVILNVIDVTDLVEARQRSEAANMVKSEFLANMSHEIRTPMAAIMGFADILGEELHCCTVCPEHGSCERRGRSRDHITTICRNGEYLLGIVNDILDLSKIEAGKLEVERIRCSLRQIVTDVMSLVQMRADAKGLPFDIEYVGPVPETIRTDPTRLRQILINLIGNAVKFTKEGSVRLLIRLIDDGDEPYLQFDVVDTGLGLTEEQVAMLFRPFAQADASTTREFGGTGLGLAISKRLARSLGGDVSVVETQEGVGTRFRATVASGALDGVKLLEDPMSATVLTTEGGAGFSPRGAARSEACDSSKLDCRILFAEDGPDNRRLISFVLKRVGAKVTVVEDGKQAVDATLAAYDEGNPFDVVLMDMQMPIVDGYEAARLLRQKGYNGLIIALTAHAMTGDRRKCIEAGCDDYVAKPINRQTLIETINAQLAGGLSYETCGGSPQWESRA